MARKTASAQLKELTANQDPLRQVIEYSALMVWKAGVPYLEGLPTCISDSPREKLLAVLEKSLDLPYSGNDPSLQGLTCGAAMMIGMTRDASEGNHEARMAILDRLLGRPKQSIESVQLTGDLNSFLDHVAAKTKEHTIEVTAEASNVPNDSAEDL